LSLVKLGFRNAFRRPVRTGLSVFGIALCVMLMITVAAVAQRYATIVDQSYDIYSSDVVVVSRAAVLVEGLPLGSAMPETVVPQISEVGGVSSATPILLSIDIQELVPTNITIGIPIQNFSTFVKNAPVQLKGSYPATDSQIVVGEYLAKTTNLTVGSTVKTGGETLTVSGVMSTSNLILSSAVMMPLPTAQATQKYQGLVSAVLVTSRGVQTGDLIGRIDSAVPGVTALDPRRSNILSNPLLASIQAVNVSVQGISILLAFLFVAIICTVNVLDQESEFWTIRAIGSSSGSILKVVLAETGLTSASGFVLGVALSAISTAVAFQVYGSLPLSAALMGTPDQIPVPLVAFAGLLVVGFGMLVGGGAVTAMLRKLK
jgi:ABC-type lipoprotein release transport system permease subunit